MYIKIHFYLFIFSVYAYMTGRLETYIIFYSYTLIHELAHVFTMILLRIPIKEIVFLPAGVNAKYNNNVSNIKEILIASSGPLASIVLAFILKNEVFFNMNIFIAILNLIPIYP